MCFLYLDVIACVVGDAVVQQVEKMLFNIRKNRRLRRLLLHLGTSFICPDFEISHKVSIELEPLGCGLGRTYLGGKGNPKSPTYLEETPGRTPHR